MKKLIIVLFLFCFITPCFAEEYDRIMTQVQFKKFIWTCPKCGQVDYEDAKVAGGNHYLHDCSKCGFQFNQSGSNMKEYNGVLNYTRTEYLIKKQTEIDAAKQTKLDNWLDELAHPPVYQEPTITDYKNLYTERINELNIYAKKISEKGSEADKTEAQEQAKGIIQTIIPIQNEKVIPGN